MPNEKHRILALRKTNFKKRYTHTHSHPSIHANGVLHSCRPQTDCSELIAEKQTVRRQLRKHMEMNRLAFFDCARSKKKSSRAWSLHCLWVPRYGVLMTVATKLWLPYGYAWKTSTFSTKYFKTIRGSILRIHSRLHRCPHWNSGIFGTSFRLNTTKPSGTYVQEHVICGTCTTHSTAHTVAYIQHVKQTETEEWEWLMWKLGGTWHGLYNALFTYICI